MICVKKKTICRKKKNKMPSSRVEGKNFEMELKQELWRAFLSPLVSAVI
jgi:hypothetical protein